MDIERTLCLRAGPAARAAIATHGLTPEVVGALAGAAGGPKWLVLSAIDQYLFGDWLTRADHEIALIGSSIGAWRFAAACHPRDPARAIETLEQAYLAQRYSDSADRDEISRVVRAILDRFFTDEVVDGVLEHPRYRLHMITARARVMTASERRPLLAAGTALGAAANAVSRRALGAFYERVVFARDGDRACRWAVDGIPTRIQTLCRAGARDVVYASGNIPLIMHATVDPAGAPPGVYRDGGLLDYHIDHPVLDKNARAPVVLMPHFADRLVPGWFDKAWRRRRPRFADHTLLVGPGPGLLRHLVDERVPDRKDFYRYAGDDPARLRAWRAAIDAGRRLRDAFAALAASPDPIRYIHPLS